MSDHPPFDAKVLFEIEAALETLNKHPSATVPVVPDPLPSLLERCEALCERAAAETPVLFRSVHHFACTGGTLISKAIGALPNTVLLSEIDPLSTQHLQQPRRPFFPTDILADLHYNPRISDTSLVVETFLAGVTHMAESLRIRGLHLALRDHAHSHFCSDVAPTDRQTLHEILSGTGYVRALVTVRHPLDSFLSLSSHNWRHFSPFTLTEYCLRYEQFLNRHEGLPISHYEDFVADPKRSLEEISQILDLPFNPSALDSIDLMAFSGDSGRKSRRIKKRPRRDIPDDIAEQIVENSTYDTLCARLGYPA